MCIVSIMLGTATGTDQPSGSREPPGAIAWEGFALMSAGLGLAPHIWWVGLIFAGLGICLTAWSRR